VSWGRDSPGEALSGRFYITKQITAMKMKFFISILLFSAFSSVFSQNSEVIKNNEFTLTLQNRKNIKLNDIIVKIDINKIKKSLPLFDLSSYSITENNKLVNAEIVKNSSTLSEDLLINLSFNPGEQKVLALTKSLTPNPAPAKRTQAYLGQKTGYKRVDKYYKEGSFETVDFTKVPADHFAHDALYQFEGPGWESDKVGYRFYLDDRNRTDIFGKTTDKVVLNIVGKDDLDSGNEGYQNPQDWGMDIFKVGNSLGIGSIATMLDGKVITVSKTDSVTCKILNNNNLLSAIRTTYYGWNVGDKKYGLVADLSIEAGSRLTKNELYLKGELSNICTGIAKHDSTDFFTSKSNNREAWAYIALYGKQSRDGGNLGLAVFYKKADLIKTGDDKDSYLILLKPVKGSVIYYFTAAWDKEPNGIKNKEEFKKYLDETCKVLGNEIQAVVRQKK